MLEFNGHVNQISFVFGFAETLSTVVLGVGCEAWVVLSPRISMWFWLRYVGLQFGAAAAVRMCVCVRVSVGEGRCGPGGGTEG